MAKKKKLTKQERKEQRRAAMEQVRQERGWEPPPPPPPVQHNELLDDMLPLFPEIADPNAPLPSIEPVLETVASSFEWADEPEFEAIIVDPMLCAATFVEAAEEMGYDPDALLDVLEEERQDAHLDILSAIIHQLFSEDLRQQILDGLEQLRVRLKEANDREGAAQAALLLSFLGWDVGSEMWTMVGLVQAIFERSVYIGFEMAEAGLAAAEAGDLDEDPVTLLNKLTKSRVAQKAESLLKKIPGLSKYLADQADVTWDEGQHAVFMGELYLGLYSDEELLFGLDLFRQTLGEAIEEARSEGRKVALSEEEALDFFTRVDQYVAELVTPERLDQMRARLDAVLRARDFEEEWFSFVLMLKQYMDEPDAAEVERHFLVSAFVGEIRRGGEALENKLENEEEA